MATAEHIIRRFCSCPEAVCDCGLPKPRSGWTVQRLQDLLKARRRHDLKTTAEALGETRYHCGIALDVLSGRSPEHALAVLEARMPRA